MSTFNLRSCLNWICNFHSAAPPSAAEFWSLGQELVKADLVEMVNHWQALDEAGLLIREVLLATCQQNSEGEAARKAVVGILSWIERKNLWDAAGRELRLFAQTVLNRLGQPLLDENPFLQAMNQADAPSREEAKARIGQPPFQSAGDLARVVGNSPPRAVESFLRRYRAKYPDCYTTSDAPRRNEPRYLYRVADVLPALKEHFKKKANLTDG